MGPRSVLHQGVQLGSKRLPGEGQSFSLIQVPLILSPGLFTAGPFFFPKLPCILYRMADSTGRGAARKSLAKIQWQVLIISLEHL